MRERLISVVSIVSTNVGSFAFEPCWVFDAIQDEPAREDVVEPLRLTNIATPLGISVHDHIIVGNNGHASLKGMRLI